MKTKSFYIAIIYCFGFLYCHAQTQTTIYTPQGNPVTAYNQIPEMSSEDKEQWSDDVEYHYPSASEQNAPSATNSYNCHGYAWHVSEGGSNRWIGLYGYDQNPEEMEDIYWEDASYIRVSSESIADKISYYADNHSAIQTSTQGVYISKWGPGPRMQHSRGYGPSDYLMNYRYYYAKPQLIGPSMVCWSASGTYSVQDFSGVTYSWTKSDNLTFTSSTSGRTISVRPSSSGISGSAYVEVTITVTAYNETNVIRKYLWAGKPNPNSIEFFSDPWGLEHELSTCETVSGEAEHPYESMISAFQWDIPNASDWEITEEYSGGSSDYKYVEIDYWEDPAPSQELVMVRTTNSCGTSSWKSIYWDVDDCGGWYMSLSPNPANDYVDIAVTKNDQAENASEYYEVKIYNSLKIVVYESGKTKDSVLRINTFQLKNGVYFIHFIAGEQTEVKQLVVNH